LRKLRLIKRRKIFCRKAGRKNFYIFLQPKNSITSSLLGLIKLCKSILTSTYFVNLLKTICVSLLQVSDLTSFFIRMIVMIHKLSPLQGFLNMSKNCNHLLEKNSFRDQVLQWQFFEINLCFDLKDKNSLMST